MHSLDRFIAQIPTAGPKDDSRKSDYNSLPETARYCDFVHDIVLIIYIFCAQKVFNNDCITSITFVLRNIDCRYLITLAS